MRISPKYAVMFGNQTETVLRTGFIPQSSTFGGNSAKCLYAIKVGSPGATADLIHGLHLIRIMAHAMDRQRCLRRDKKRRPGRHTVVYVGERAVVPFMARGKRGIDGGESSEERFDERRFP